MTEARQREAWNHTASLLAMLANANRDPKRCRPAKPSDFHPLIQPKSLPLKADFALLKRVFVDVEV